MGGRKILVEVRCPATSKSYEFILPGKMTVKTVIRKMTEEILFHENNMELFPEDSSLMLWDYDRKEALNKEYSLEQSGIYGGNILYLL